MCQKFGADIFFESPEHGDILSIFDGSGYTAWLKTRSRKLNDILHVLYSFENLHCFNHDCIHEIAELQNLVFWSI